MLFKNWFFIKKISAENLQLREAVNQRTKELEHKNRELAIEAALERVRTRAMAMHKSIELADTAKVMIDQMKLLGINTFAISIGIFQTEKQTYDMWISPAGELIDQQFQIPYENDANLNAIHQAWLNQEESLSQIMTGDRLLNHLQFLDSHGFPAHEFIEMFKVGKIKKHHVDSIFFKHGALDAASPLENLNVENKNILIRFAKVFEQTYTRFLDLQKAETQAREAQIQLALERVRARTMAMHKSDELAETSAVLFQQMRELSVTPDRLNICLIKEKTNILEIWSTDQNGIKINHHFNASLDEPTTGKRVFDAWKQKKKTAVIDLSGQELNDWIRYVREVMGMRIKTGQVKEHRVHSAAFFSHGMVLTTTHQPLSVESLSLLERFAEVFNLTYRRFLDLQHAEAQAQEAQIEAALERVRAQTMAMHDSEDVGKCIVKMFGELTALGVDEGTRFGIGILNHDNENNQLWTAKKDGEEVKMHIGNLDMTAHPLLKSARKAWKAQVPLHKYVLEGDDLLNYYRMINAAPDYKLQIALEKLPEREFHYGFIFDHGFFYAFSPSEFHPDLIHIVQRFSSLFGQTYRRYLDLVKAEGQAREAQIEAALERVRSRSLAMHTSDELLKVIRVVSEQLLMLGVRFDHVSFAVNNEQSDFTFWSSIVGYKEPVQLDVPFLDNPMYRRLMKARKRDADFFTDTLTPEESREYLEHMFKHVDLSFVDKKKKEAIFKGAFARSVAILPQIMLILANYAGQEYSDEENNLIRRFAKVFEQAFTRFLDLQKAEAQAREAQVETALERVRSRSMAMHKSEDLRDVVNTLYGEFQSLNVIFHVAAIQLIPDNSKDLNLWLSTADGMYDDIIHWPYTDLPIINEIYKSRATGKMFEYTLSKTETKEFFEEYFKLEAVPKERKTATQNVEYIDFMGSYQDLTGIYLMRYTEGSYSLYEKDIVRRFAKVFEQTYTRFLDLQKAEAQAREAIKQASLDRIRGEIASMRTKDDLNRITPLIWKELTTLDVPFIRCGVFIMNEEKRVIQTYLSTPDGNSLAAFEMSFDDEGIASRAVKKWKENNIYRDFWNKNQFVGFMQNLIKTGQVKNIESFQGSAAPPESLYLNFVPFKQGMLYVGNISELKEEVLQLVQSLADSFSIAYARYEDFRQLEEAKNQIEKTFTELKATQSQLIQAEKMASLGELTAGIAHEIQNPLNFVNNFSEVSEEMIDEMNEELNKGEIDEAKAISEDLKQNLQKIHHHGQRASGIVKGMLEHSRTGNGVKELTDINALADEYLRLAYHGLRAKDKTFNADFKTDLDPALPKVNVIPQDIGRVLLNLINNAFFAVTEMKKRADLEGFKNLQGLDSYKPKVSVSTKLSPAGGGKGVEKVQISVKDNGPGIPEEIKEKIFQPFFTTKPTGSGTGLGLSLSYDIVKAHGGKIKVESAPGDHTGTTFIIILPL